ncbi:MAG: tRNA (adenine-N1)-methyltransferase [Chloroflexi bacterium]|nr:tRNA (adenine-N1)-methyltransferase [Chloroflexota bacterium]
MNRLKANDWILLITKDDKRFTLKLEPGALFHSHRGMLSHNEMIGQSLGETVYTNTGSPVLLLTPSIEDQILNVRRAGTIMYPKEIGYILLKLNIQPGVRVVEAGCGSGGLTVALANYVRPGGKVYSYDMRDDMVNLARRNVERLNLEDGVEFTCQDISLGFLQQDIDAIFLDVREPWLYLQQVFTALRPGGFFGALVPTTNQISALLRELPGAGLGLVEVSELIQRHYKPVAERLRPEDRLTAHTGYLIFARKIFNRYRDSVEAVEETPEID